MGALFEIKLKSILVKENDKINPKQEGVNAIALFLPRECVPSVASVHSLKLMDNDIFLLAGKDCPARKNEIANLTSEAKARKAKQEADQAKFFGMVNPMFAGNKVALNDENTTSTYFFDKTGNMYKEGQAGFIEKMVYNGVYYRYSKRQEIIKSKAEYSSLEESSKSISLAFMLPIYFTYTGVYSIQIENDKSKLASMFSDLEISHPNGKIQTINRIDEEYPRTYKLPYTSGGDLVVFDTTFKKNKISP